MKTEKELGNYLVGLKNGINAAVITEIGMYKGFRMYLETLLLRDYDNRVSLEHSLFFKEKAQKNILLMVEC